MRSGSLLPLCGASLFASPSSSLEEDLVLSGRTVLSPGAPGRVENTALAEHVVASISELLVPAVLREAAGADAYAVGYAPGAIAEAKMPGIDAFLVRKVRGGG